MLKLLHTADLHLGARFVGLGAKGAAQREHVRAALSRAISLAIAERVDMFLVAGDLFDSNRPSQRNIDLVIEQFGLLDAKGIPVCVIPGTHDCFDSNAVYRKANLEQSCPNLRVFRAQGWDYQEYPGLDLTVYGRANLANRSYDNPLEGLKRRTHSTYHVAMAHGSLRIPEQTSDDDHVFAQSDIAQSGMHYIALGHWHRRYACSVAGVTAWYPGPPELISLDQKEPGTVLVVSVDDGGEVSVESRQTGTKRCDEKTIDVASLDSSARVRDAVLQDSDPDLVRRVTLTGLRDRDLTYSSEELERELEDRFFHLRVTDKSHPKLGSISEDLFPEQVIVAKFIRLMKERIEQSEGEDREIAEEALQYGLALLQGKEVI